MVKDFARRLLHLGKNSSSTNSFERLKRKFLDELKVRYPFTYGQNFCVELEKSCLLNFDSNVWFKNNCNVLVRAGAELIVGSNCFFNNACSINCLGKIVIGDNSIFGESVKIYDHNHKHGIRNNKLEIERNEFNIGEVNIGCNCWIGSNVTILKDIVIGDNTIIGANCLIHKSIPANSIVKLRGDLDIQTR